jgi:hypothetical protein
MSNSQEDRMTQQMWDTMPDGGSVCYHEGHSYDEDRTPTVYDGSVTYTWQTCGSCDADGVWCVSRTSTVSPPTHYVRYDRKDGGRWSLMGGEMSWVHLCSECSVVTDSTSRGYPMPTEDWRDVEVGTCVPIPSA